MADAAKMEYIKKYPEYKYHHENLIKTSSYQETKCKFK